MQARQPRTRIAFDRLARIFDDQRGLPPEALEALYRAFGDLVDQGASTLIEPGAGTGRIATPALAAGFSVTAIDVSQPMLDVFRDRLTNVPELASRCELVAGDAVALPVEADRFDVGLLAQVLYLVPDWEQALNEVVRVLKPGGKVLLVQERTTMSPGLARWDAAWRKVTERAGHVTVPQEPDDAAAVAALVERTVDVTETELASWTFGQTVRDRLASLDRMRSLYPSLSDDAWDAVLKHFREWREHTGPDETAWLGGSVALVLVAGVVPTYP